MESPAKNLVGGASKNKKIRDKVDSEGEKWQIFISFSVPFYASPLLKRIQTDMSVVPRSHYTGTKGRPEWVFRSAMKIPIN